MAAWMEILLFLALLGVFLSTAVLTLLGVSGRLFIRDRYLAPLVAALLVEGVAVVLSLAGTLEREAPSARRLMASLPPEVRGGTVDETLRNVEEAVEGARALGTTRSTLAAVEAEHRRALERLAELEEEGGHFLVRMVRFHRAAAGYGGSLNLIYPPDPAKEALARDLLGLLGELGSYDGPLEPDPHLAREALASYQRSRGFRTLGWYSRPTFDAMVEDHLAAGRRADSSGPVRGGTPAPPGCIPRRGLPASPSGEGSTDGSAPARTIR